MPENAYIREFLENLRDRKYSEKSIEKYHNCLKRFRRFLEDHKAGRFQDIDLKLLESYRLVLVEANYSSHSVESFLQAVKLFFSFLAEQSLIFENPASELVIRRARPKLGYVMTEKEVKQLLASPDISKVLGLRDRAILEVLYSTGIRREELVNLKVFDIDTDKQTLRVIGKGRKERILPLGKHASEYAALYLKTVRPVLASRKNSLSDALWLDYKGMPLSEQSARITVKRHVRKAKLNDKINTHCLRRTCATHLLRNGAHPLMVSKLLGHADIRTLSHYLQVSITDLMKSHAGSKPGK